MNLTVSSWMDGRFTVVKPEGAINNGNAHALKVRLFDLLELRRRRFVVDLSRAVFEDFTGLAPLILLALKIREFKGTLRIVVGDPDTADFLERTGFLRYYPPYDSVDIAVKQPIYPS